MNEPSMKTLGVLLFDALIKDEKNPNDPNREGKGPFTPIKDGGTVLNGLYDLDRAAVDFLTHNGMLGKWRPMSEHKAPWPHERMAVAAFNKDEPENIRTIVCTCADHGKLYPQHPEGSYPLALEDMGLTAFAWLDMSELIYTIDTAVEAAVKEREQDIALDNASNDFGG
jgi:hypothetical protein